MGISSLRRQSWLAQLVLIAAFGVLMLFVIPSVVSDFRLNLLGKLLTFAIVAIGLDLLWGYGGMLSLGQGVFFGLGAYGMAMFMKLESTAGNLPDFMVWSGLNSMPWFWKPFEHAYIAIPVAIIGPGVLAFLLGFVVFRSRVKGVYFSILTQALALTLSTFLVGQQAFTGGTNGITDFTTVFGRYVIATDTQHLLYTITVISVIATYMVAYAITKSRFGRLLVALRDDEERVRFTGYNVAVLKAVVFGISGAMAGLAGALYVPQVGIISPANLAVVPSIEMVIWVAIGGRGSLSGAVVGAITVGLAKSYLSESFPDFWLYFLGGLFIGAVVLIPRGIVGSLGDALDWLTRFLRGRRATIDGKSSEAEPAIAAAAPGVVSRAE